MTTMTWHPLLQFDNAQATTPPKKPILVLVMTNFIISMSTLTRWRMPRACAVAVSRPFSTQPLYRTDLNGRGRGNITSAASPWPRHAIMLTKMARWRHLSESTRQSGRHESMRRACEAHEQAVESVAAAMRDAGVVVRMQDARDDVAASDLAWADVCVALGGDGTTLRAAHTAPAGMYVVGVNTDPQRSVGKLCSATVGPSSPDDDAQALVDSLVRGAFREKLVPRLKVSLELEQPSSTGGDDDTGGGSSAPHALVPSTVHAINECFISELDPSRPIDLEVCHLPPSPAFSRLLPPSPAFSRHMPRLLPPSPAISHHLPPSPAFSDLRRLPSRPSSRSRSIWSATRTTTRTSCVTAPPRRPPSSSGLRTPRAPLISSPSNASKLSLPPGEPISTDLPTPPQISPPTHTSSHLACPHLACAHLP